MTPRPLSAKTVRNIAGVVSSAFARAIRWGLSPTNPVTNSEPPRVKKLPRRRLRIRRIHGELCPLRRQERALRAGSAGDPGAGEPSAARDVEPHLRTGI